MHLFLQELLEDPVPQVRSISVLGVFSVMQSYWEMIPQQTLKFLTVKLLQDCLSDSSSADVRESVIKVTIDTFRFNFWTAFVIHTNKTYQRVDCFGQAAWCSYSYTCIYCIVTVIEV